MTYIILYVRGAVPSSAFALYAKVIKFFNNNSHLNSTTLMFEQSFLEDCDKKLSFNVESKGWGIIGILHIRNNFCLF